MTRRALVTLAALLATVVLAARPAWADLEPYADSNDPLATTPSTDDGSFGAWHNPAGWAVPQRGLLDVALFDRNGDLSDLKGWQVGMGRGLGFSVRHYDPGPAPPDSTPPALTEYQIAIAGGGGDGEHFNGLAYHFAGSGKTAWRRSSYLTLGSITRPIRYFSLGATTRWAPGTGDADGVIDLGIRPFGTSRLTIFGDLAPEGLFKWGHGTSGAGASLRPVDGIELSGRWRNDDHFQFTIGLTLMRTGVRVTPKYRHRDTPSSGQLTQERRRGDTDHLGTWFSLRVQPPVRGADMERGRLRGRRYMSMDLHGRAVYQSYRLFDEDALPLRDLTEQIRFAREDPTVGGVAIRLSGFDANVSTVWELRESLLALKRAGKKVLVAADRLDAKSYYLASTADWLVVDPVGGLLLPGLQASRTYMKDLLAKLGIGFEEWRYYKYKSALETFSRTNFSDADREQYDAVVRAAYDELADGIAASGRMSRAEFDRVVNEEPYLTPQRMKELGWADTLGRWDELVSKADSLGARGTPRSYAWIRARRYQPEENWGPPPTIALVYLVGDCAMDEGIRARTTARRMEALRKDPSVKAVVLRVDSPGGDPVASDVVAAQTRKLREGRTPTLVSQGRVAGSGGYWISMDGESIATSPFTITGSIGVIGGWAWNEGFGKKTGLTSDHVQVGRSADLFGGLRVPFLGATLPERNLDARERRLVEGVFDDLYGRFTTMAAGARGLSVERVRELAQGRIYDGKAAVENHLVDRVATLEETIEAAKRRAGIRPGRRVRVVEVPERPLIRLPSFLPGIRGASIGGVPIDGAPASTLARPYETGAIQQILDQPGRPLLVMPPSLLPLEDEAVR